MSFRKWATLTALVLTIGGMVPAAPAAAEPAPAAACGTTADRWVGTFRGTMHFEGSTHPDDTIELQISQGSSGLLVRTIINDWKEDPQYGPTVIHDGYLRWVTRRVAMPFALYTTFDSTSVTCSGERVTAFSGLFSVRGEYIGPMDASTFQVTRTA